LAKGKIFSVVQELGQALVGSPATAHSSLSLLGRPATKFTHSAADGQFVPSENC